MITNQYELSNFPIQRDTHDLQIRATPNFQV